MSNGNEFWYARELMKVLGYAKWQFFEDAISKAQFACQNTGSNIDEHFEFLLATVKTGGAKGGGLAMILDYLAMLANSEKGTM